MIDQYRYDGPVSVRTGENILPSLFGNNTFTRSNGSVASRLYERLTKASRRRNRENQRTRSRYAEKAYRQGVYDAFKALQAELNQ